jgi:ATP-dependent Clp protease adaptor protein ClpS
MSKTDVKTRIKPNLKLHEPNLFKIIYINDDVTTIEFVIESLMEYFQYTSENALELTKNIHNEGSAVVAVLPFEIAEQKGLEVTLAARAQGFPLQIKIEEEKT